MQFNDVLHKEWFDATPSPPYTIVLISMLDGWRRRKSGYLINFSSFA